MKKFIIAIVLSAVLVTPAFAFEDEHAAVSEAPSGGGSQTVDVGNPETPSESHGGGGSGLSKAEKLEREQLRQLLDLLTIYRDLLLQAIAQGR